MAKLFGVVLVFEDRVDRDTAEVVVRRLCEKGLVKMHRGGWGPMITADAPPTVHEFNPEHGTPVFYIP